MSASATPAEFSEPQTYRKPDSYVDGMRSRAPEPPDNATSPNFTDDENDALKSLSAVDRCAGAVEEVGFGEEIHHVYRSSRMDIVP